MSTKASEFSEGTQIGDWKISSAKPLGRGGQGAVWSVKPAATKRTPPRALKACFSEDGKDRARFSREIELMSRCDSPFIAKIFASDVTWDDRGTGAPPFAFYVTEKYEGSLEERAKDLGTIAQRLALFRDACSAVSYLHVLPEPIIHRDIKPPNFLLAKEHRRLVLGDFGIARELVSSLLTSTHEVVGTELFRAPEVARGSEGSVHSDVYSLGRVLEWLVTYEVSPTMGTRKVPRGGDLSDEACDALDRILVKATHPHPEERFGSVAELADQLPELWLTPKPRPVAEVTVATSDARAVWNAALDLARANDLIRWRQLEHKLRRVLPEDVKQWRKNCDATFRGSPQELLTMIDRLVDASAPRLVFALAGTYSQHDALSDQRRLLEELASIPDWNRGGYTVLAAAPRGLVYLFHYLHGAVCCEMGRTDLAMQLADAHVRSDSGPDTVVALWRHPDLATWPEMFVGGDSVVAWDYLAGMADKLPVLDDIFPLRRDYAVGLASYSMLLSLLEAAHRGSNTIEEIRAGRATEARIDVLPLFWKAPTDVIRAAFARTFGSREVVQLAADRANVHYGVLTELWPAWKKTLVAVRSQLMRDVFFRGETGLGDIP